MIRTALLIAHYNNPEGLAVSLASVGHDEPCDAIVVDDASATRPDEAAIRAAFTGGGQVFFIYLKQNVGPEAAANAGLEYILQRDYEFVARLDCDDQNTPGRLKKQVAYLDAHPEVQLLGGAVVFFREGGDAFVHSLPCDHRAIQRAMHVNCAFIQPSMMFRSAALAQTGLYPNQYPAADDFAFCWQFVDRFETANLPDVLVRTEYTLSGVSFSKRRRQQWSRIRILTRHFDGSSVAISGLARAWVSYLVPFSWMRFARRLVGAKKWT